MTIEVRFVDAAKEGACMGCGIPRYMVARVMLGKNEIRLCGVCADSVLQAFQDEKFFLRVTKVVARGMHE